MNLLQIPDHLSEEFYINLDSVFAVQIVKLDKKKRPKILRVFADAHNWHELEGKAALRFWEAVSTHVTYTDDIIGK